MSRYTTEVRYICETSSGLLESVGYSKVDEVIQKSLPVIFDFDFPIFDEKYRGILESKILKHYYTREIAFETVGLWKLKLATKLNEIMVYYNQLYKSELLEFNPLYDVDITRQHISDSDGTRGTTSSDNSKYDSNRGTNVTGINSSDIDSSVTGNTNSNRKDMYSDTPQGTITDLESGKYLTNARINNDVENNSSKTSGTTTDSIDTDTSENINTTKNQTRNEDVKFSNLETYIETVKGKQGSGDYSEMLKKFRTTFLNIDMMIIGELSDLFFNLW